MKLNEYELDYVKYFIQVKGYHQYEVLAEIMDHFVLLLEEKMDYHPNLPFEDLVDTVYASCGITIFEEINKSTKRRITKKINHLFFGHLMVFLNYQYVLGMALVGFLLYHLQSFLQDTQEFILSHSISTALVYFFTYKLKSATELGNPKFMCNKIIKRYGFYLFVTATVIFGVSIKVLLTPKEMGVNIVHLASTVLLIAQAVVLYSLVRTSKLISDESEGMEETYQVLK